MRSVLAYFRAISQGQGFPEREFLIVYCYGRIFRIGVAHYRGCLVARAHIPHWDCFLFLQ